jgi:hypothetical protein
MYEPDLQTRALLRLAAERAWARNTDESLTSPSHQAQFPALHALLADAAVLFSRYDLMAYTPMSSQPAFTYSAPGTLTVHVKPVSIDVRGILRETPAGGGPVRALPVDLVKLAWDPALGLLVSADPAETRSALDLLVASLLRALRLT